MVVAFAACFLVPQFGAWDDSSVVAGSSAGRDNDVAHAEPHKLDAEPHKGPVFPGTFQMLKQQFHQSPFGSPLYAPSPWCGGGSLNSEWGGSQGSEASVSPASSAPAKESLGLPGSPNESQAGTPSPSAPSEPESDFAHDLDLDLDLALSASPEPSLRKASATLPGTLACSELPCSAQEETLPRPLTDSQAEPERTPGAPPTRGQQEGEQECRKARVQGGRLSQGRLARLLSPGSPVPRLATGLQKLGCDLGGVGYHGSCQVMIQGLVGLRQHHMFLHPLGGVRAHTPVVN